MKNLQLVLVALFGLIILGSSCKKEDAEQPQTNGSLKSGDITLSRKTDYGNDWIYFSFKDAKEVVIEDYQSSNDWDIAFNRYNVRTNSGESGNALGGAYDVGKVDFASVTLAPETGYTVDDTIQIVAAFTGQGVEWMTSTGNDVFKGVIDMEYGNQGPSYIANDHIYIIKTADGKYAKLWIKSYYNDAGESGFINFKYHYQSAVSNDLE